MKVFSIKSSDNKINISGRSKNIEMVCNWINKNLPYGGYAIDSMVMPECLKDRYQKEYKQFSKMKYKS